MTHTLFIDYIWISVIAAGYFFVLSLFNIYYFKKATKAPQITNGPKVSVLIPCRNELENIAICIDSLLNQTYSNYEIIVLDDNSTDGTSELLQQYKSNPLVTIVQGRPLAEGWYGKPFAMKQLVEYATGEYIIFTDADTRHESHSLSYAMTNMLHYNADLLSVYTYHEMNTFGEKVIVPSVYIMMALVLPLILINRSKRPQHSFAIGAFLVYKKSSYEQVGGVDDLKDQINEDILLARKMKRNQYKTLFLDAKNAITTRMYRNYKSSFIGITKNIFPAVDKHLWQSIMIVIVVSSIILLPIFLFLIGLCTMNFSMIVYTAIPIVVFWAMWAMVLHDRKQSVWLACYYPFLFASLVAMTVVSTLKIGFGKGVPWKGRLVK